MKPESVYFSYKFAENIMALTNVSSKYSCGMSTVLANVISYGLYSHKQFSLWLQLNEVPHDSVT